MKREIISDAEGKKEDNVLILIRFLTPELMQATLTKKTFAKLDFAKNDEAEIAISLTSEDDYKRLMTVLTTKSAKDSIYRLYTPTDMGVARQNGKRFPKTITVDEFINKLKTDCQE